MRTILIISVFLGLTLQAKAQSTFKGSFTSVSGSYNKPAKTIELKDSIGNSILIFNKEGIVIYNKKYNFIRYKKYFFLTDSLTKDCIGAMKYRNSRSFSFDGNDYKLSKRKRNGYNFVIIDNYKNPVSFVKFKTDKTGCSIEIYNKGNDNILPFVFLVTIGEFINNKIIQDLMFIIMITS